MNSRDNMRNGIFSAQGSKDSAVLFVAGDNKMKDHTNRTNTIRRAHKMLMALLIALTMMISAAVQGVSAFAANNNDTVRVATYDQLQEALEETKGVKEIVVDPQAAVDEGEVVYSVEGDENNNAFYIGFDEALTVSDDITITSADDVDVYFARSDSFKNDQEKPALLNIESEGNLNLDGLITMTGEEVATTFYEANEVNPAEFVFSVKSKDGTGEDNEVWNSDQALKGGFYIQNNGGEYTLGDDVVMKDINLADDVEDAEQIHEEKAASSNEEVVVEKSADAAESTDSEEVAGVWEEKEEEAAEEAPVVSAPKRSLMSLKSTPMMKSAGATGPSRTVATHAQLKAALEDPNVTEIIIDESGFVDKDGNVVTQKIYYKEGNSYTTKSGVFYLGVDAPLTVAAPASGERKVTIKSANSNKEVRIARSDKFVATDENPAIFNVSKGTELELDGKVTMTGEKVSTRQISDGFYNFYSDIKWSTGKGVPRNDVPTLTYEKKRYVHLFGYNDNGTALNSTTALSGFAEDGYLIRNSEGHYLAIGHNQTGAETNAVWLAEKDVITVSTDGSRPKIYQGAVWTPKYNNSTADNGKYMLTSGANNQGSEYWLGIDTSSGTIKGIKKVNGHGDTAGYGNLTTSSGGHLVYSGNHSISVAFNNTNPATKLQTAFGGGELSGFEMFKASNVVAFPDEITIFTVDKKDASTGNGGAWTKDEVKPGGYFIHANNGGKVTINDGVTIGNLKTKCGFELKDKPYEENPYSDDTVFNVAPIYVGGGATLDFNGGVITGNEVGYGEGIEAHSQSSVQNLKKWFNDSAPTNTAGAIIASGENTNVTISGNATITGNKADAGALIIKDAAKVTMNATKASKGDTANDAEKVRGISYNVGWHHSGAVLVENGGEFLLEDGSIHNNVAWLKGGAVWATEFGTIGLVRWTKYPTAMQHSDDVRKNRDGGKFVMNGGELTDNFSFVRAGAVEVESNYVYLNNGTISNNMCKSLGGAIYIEGDSPIYSYTLNLRNGYIHDNTAVDSVPDDDLDRRLVDGKLSATDDSNNKDYSLSVGWHKDGDWANYGQKHSGDGGGIWLCSMGGTSVFTSTKDKETNPDKKAQVYIAGNHASSEYDTVTDNGWGNDFYISHRHGSALVQNLIGDWYGDDGKNGVAVKSDKIDTEDEKGIVMKGPKGMYNAITSYSNVSGIQIIGNRARNGGAIACNGTIILGSASSVYRYEAEFDITKAWEDGVAENEVTLRLFYDANKNGKFDEGTDFLLEKDATLDANESPYYEVKLGAGEGITPTGNEVIYKTGKNTAKASIPSSVQHNGQTIELYKIKNQQAEGPILMGNSDTHIDTTDKAHLEALFKYLNTNGSKEVPLDIDWFVGIQEDGDKYSTTLQTATATATSRVGKTVKLVNPDNGEEISEGSFTVNFSDVTFGQTLTNGLKRKDFEISKVDPSGKEIKKTAEFRLFDAEWVENGKHWKVKDVNQTNNTFTVDASTGKLKLENLVYGRTYLLFETAAPEGYTKQASPWLVTVGSNGSVKVKILSTYKVNQWHYDRSIPGEVKIAAGYEYTTDPNLSNIEWPDGWYNGNVNNLKNEPLNVRLTKMGVSVEETTPINGAKFALYKSGISTDNLYYEIKKGASALDENIQSKTVAGSNGVIEFQVPEPGHYFLFETQAPEGHIRQVEPWLIEVDNGGKVVTYKYINSEGNKWVGRDHKVENIPDTHAGVKTGISDSWRGWKREWYEGESHVVTGNKIENQKIYTLPKAGGMGTYWFMIIGMMMMAFAATMVLTKKSAVRR